MQTIKIHSRIKDYSVSFLGMDKLCQFLDEQRNVISCFIVDANVWNLYSKNLLGVIDTSKVITILPTEENKSYETVLAIYKSFIEYSLKRNSLVVVIGGGVIQDLAGFACSTFYRGVEWVFITTTLLAQADSCIGGKTSLNFGSYKNIFGTFYPPSQVVVCIDFLRSLDDIYYYSGLGEVAKLQIIGGEKNIKTFIEMKGQIQKRDLFSLEKLIYNSLLVKASFIADDEFDKSRRRLLNFGHSFGHAIETVSNFAVPHGQAVLLGMYLANSISVKRGLLSIQKHNHITENILNPVLFHGLEIPQLDNTLILEAMKKDKKRFDDRLIIILLSETLELMEYNDLAHEEVAHAFLDLYGWVAE